MVTNSLRLDGTRWDEVKDLIRIQDQNGIITQQDGTREDRRVPTSNPLCFLLRQSTVRPYERSPSFEGAFLVPSTSPIGKAPGRGTWKVGGSAAGASRYTGSPFCIGGGPSRRFHPSFERPTTKFKPGTLCSSAGLILNFEDRLPEPNIT